MIRHGLFEALRDRVSVISALLSPPTRELALGLVGMPAPSRLNSISTLRPRATDESRESLPDSRELVLGAFFGRGDDKIRDSIAGRLRILGDRAKDDAKDDPPLPAEDDATPPPVPPLRGVGVLVFTAGPRIGETVSLERRSVAFDRDGNQVSDLSASGVVASIWEQGPHVMLRDSGGVVVAGLRLSVPVVTLDDGDDIAWGPHRLQFRIVPPVDEPRE